MIYINSKTIKKRAAIKSPSLKILHSKITDYFKINFKTKPLIFTDPVTLAKHKKTCDLVFMGNAINILLRSNIFNPKSHYRLWTLSHSHAQLLSTYLDLPFRSIGVIPRYKLYPKRGKAKYINLSRAINLIYSGRIVEGKNVDLVILFAKHMMNKLGCEVHVHICYPQANLKELKKVKALSRQYNIPLFDHKDLGEKWYQHLKMKNKVLINLSTYACEDFNVSTALADQLGWPQILSSWGCFHDLRRPNIDLISLNDLMNMKQGRDISISLKNVLRPKTNQLPRAITTLASMQSGKDLLTTVKARKKKFKSSSALVNYQHLTRIHLQALSKNSSRGKI